MTHATEIYDWNIRYVRYIKGLTYRYRRYIFNTSRKIYPHSFSHLIWIRNFNKYQNEPKKLKKLSCF